MTLPDSIRSTPAASETTVINAASIVAGANKLSTEVTTSGRREAIVTVSITPGSSTTGYVEVYALLAGTGGTYPDGGDSIDPSAPDALIGILSLINGTAAHVGTFHLRGILAPSFKVLLISEAGATVTATVTVELVDVTIQD